LGKVTDIQIDDSISFVKTADGRVVASSTPGYVSYHITLEATGVPSDLGGVIFDGMDYQIGKSMTVKWEMLFLWAGLIDWKKRGNELCFMTVCF